MTRLAKALQAAILITPLLIGIIHGMDMSRSMHDLRNNLANFEWGRDSHFNTNEAAPGDPMTVLLKNNPWEFYVNRDKSTFARDSRGSEVFQPRMGRDEEIQFTETSRSPPFAPRLGRGFHNSPRFRRIPTALN